MIHQWTQKDGEFVPTPLFWCSVPGHNEPYHDKRAGCPMCRLDTIRNRRSKIVFFEAGEPCYAVDLRPAVKRVLLLAAFGAAVWWVWTRI